MSQLKHVMWSINFVTMYELSYATTVVWYIIIITHNMNKMFNFSEDLYVPIVSVSGILFK